MRHTHTQKYRVTSFSGSWGRKLALADWVFARAFKNSRLCRLCWRFVIITCFRLALHVASGFNTVSNRTFAGFTLKTEPFSATYPLVCLYVSKNYVQCWNSALLAQGTPSSSIRGKVKSKRGIKIQRLECASRAVGVCSEAVCDQTCFRELHTVHWSATGAEVILEGCGVMVLQDQTACALSPT